jgi:hypothetical protein
MLPTFAEMAAKMAGRPCLKLPLACLASSRLGRTFSVDGDSTGYPGICDD